MPKTLWIREQETSLFKPILQYVFSPQEAAKSYMLGLYVKQSSVVATQAENVLLFIFKLQSIYVSHAPFMIMKSDSYMVLYRRGIIRGIILIIFDDIKWPLTVLYLQYEHRSKESNANPHAAISLSDIWLF